MRSNVHFFGPVLRAPSCQMELICVLGRSILVAVYCDHMAVAYSPPPPPPPRGGGVELIFFLPPLGGGGGVDLSSSNCGCARLSSGVAPPLPGWLKKKWPS